MPCDVAVQIVSSCFLCCALTRGRYSGAHVDILKAVMEVQNW